jgi:integrase
MRRMKSGAIGFVALALGIGLVLSIATAELVLRVLRLAPSQGIATVDEAHFDKVPGLLLPGQDIVDLQKPALPHHVHVNSLGWLLVERAAKGGTHEAPIRGTKTGKAKRLPFGEELATWIARYAADRIGRAPLFVSPRTGRPWTHSALRDRWIAATKVAGVERVGLYEGTKHTFATDALRRKVPERALQAFLGHADTRSTRRYARMADEALVSVLRRPALVPTLSPAGFPSGKSPKIQGKLASPAGFEPALSP